MSDGFLEAYAAYTGFDWYPANFHRAMGYTLVGLALGRRVWVQDGRWPVYPLLHTIMIADSGIGKGACVEMMYRVQREAIPDLIVARKEGSAAGLLKRLPITDRRQTRPVLIEAAEATTMLNRAEYLCNMVPVLTELADNNTYGKSLKDGHLDICDVQVSIVLGTNEKALRERFSASIIEEGLASRLVWLRAGWSPKPLDRIPEDSPPVLRARGRAVEMLRGVSQLSGPVKLNGPAAAWFRSWQEEFDQSEPPDRALSGYWSRRYIHLLRAALIHAVSAGRLEILQSDLESAWFWIQETEAQMMESFGSLRLSGYGQVEAVMLDWIRVNRPCWTALLREWSGRLSGRESVRRVLDSLLAAGRVAEETTERGGGKRYVAVGD